MIVLDRLDHASYGLAALNNDLDSLILRLGDPSPSTIKGLIDAVEAKLDNGTYGLSALETLLTDIEGSGFIANTHSLVNIAGYVDEVEGLLKNASYGLSALKTLIDAVEGKLDNATYGLSALKTLIDAIEAKLDSATYGLSALNNDLDTLLSRLTATRAGYLDNLSGGAVALEATLTAIKGAGWTTETLKAIYDAIASLNDLSASEVWSYSTRTLTNPASASDLSNMRVALQSDPLNVIRDAILSDATKFAGANIATILSEIQNGTYGLSALNTDLDAIKAQTDNLPSDPADESELEARLGRKVSCMTFWSDVQEEAQLTTGGTNVSLPDVVVAGLPSGFTLVRVIVLLKFRAVENTNASANKLSGAQNIRIKKSTGSWGVDDLAAIDLVDDMWGIAASTREFGDVLIGDNDVKAEVDDNATYNIRFENALTDQNYLNLNDVQVGVQVWFV